MAVVASAPHPRRLVVLRHGERIDFTFGEEWIDKCFDDKGNYSKRNLNLPPAVPKRPKKQDFYKDCPLTEIGSLQAFLVGKGLRSETILQPGFKVYVSPALRCVETAAGVMRGLGLESPPQLCIEPTLFEWTGWTPNGNPTWMSPEALVSSGFDIDTSYIPFRTPDQITPEEPVEDYYNRSFEWIKWVLNQDQENDVLVVAHGSSLDAVTRQLLGGKPRAFREMMGVLRGVPYCGVAITEKESSDPEPLGTWKLVSNASNGLSMRHTSSEDFCALKQFMGEEGLGDNGETTGAGSSSNNYHK